VGKGGAPRRDESAKELSDRCGRARTQTPGIVRIEPNGRAHARLVAAALCSPFVVAALWRGDDPFGSILLELAPLLLFFNRFLAAAIAIAVAAAAAAAAAAFSAFSFAFRAPCTPDEEPNRRPSERTQSALHTLMIRPDAAMRHAL
jgi:hypothetical protein